MKNEAIMDYYIYDNKMYSVNNKEILTKVTSPSIYEVIRIIDGIPLYAYEHLRRLRKSAELIKCNVKYEDAEILNSVFELIKVNSCRNLNVKIIVSNLYSDNQILVVYFVTSNYPENDVYRNGIKTILINSERKNPNAKIVNTSLRSIINDELKKVDAYEALLVNRKGCITEGSKSNVFFVKDNIVYTAPPSNVLLGVTRNKIISICKNSGYKIIEKNIYQNELNKFDGAFITGTSVSVLPITTIDDFIYDSVNNDLINNISDKYNEDVKKNINRYREEKISIMML